MPNKLERFSQAARNVLEYAQEEAENLHHTYIGTEHFLIGLMREEAGIAGRALRTIFLDHPRVDQPGVTLAFAKILHPPMVPSGERPQLSPESKKALEFAVDEARREESKEIDTEHLLFGLLRVTEGGAQEIFAKFNIAPDDIRKEIIPPRTAQLLEQILEKESSRPGPPLPPEIRSSMRHQRLERFTQRTRRVLSLAQEEAERMQHSYIGTEHFLIGLMREEGGVASRVLGEIGLDIKRVTELAEKMTKASKRDPNTPLDLAPDVTKTLELGVEEARRLGHHYIGTEHLLLGLVRQTEGTAIDILKRVNVSPEEVRRQTRRFLQESLIQAGQPKGTAHYNWFAALSLAHAHAAGFHHRQIGPEHLLLAILLIDRDIVWDILEKAGVTIERVLPLVKALPSEKLEPPANPELSPELVHVLGWAVIEAFRANVPFLRSDYLALGLFASGENGATRLLKELNVDPATIEKALRER